MLNNIEDVTIRQGDVNSFKRAVLASRQSHISMGRRPLHDEFTDFTSESYSYSGFYIKSETEKRLVDLVSDKEFFDTIVQSIKFAIPPMERIFIVFESEGKEDFKFTSFIIERKETKFKMWECLQVTFENHNNNLSNVGESSRVTSSRMLTIVDTERKKPFLVKDANGEFLKPEEVEVGMLSEYTLVIVLLFLLIHRRPNYLYTIPASHKMVGNKRVAYAAHKTIDLKIFEPKEVISRIAPPTGSHASPRRHDVMGHWMHWNVDIRCDHEWERVVLEEDDPRRRFRENGTEIIRHVCKHCGGRRTFRDHFVRGDATKGCFTHDYVA